ncbi:unnamed protein product [Debaryomyces tyrocola]|nr:unnamed protein product [Debaryomyces tyrocola]
MSFNFIVGFKNMIKQKRKWTVVP